MPNIIRSPIDCHSCKASIKFLSNASMGSIHLLTSSKSQYLWCWHQIDSSPFMFLIGQYAETRHMFLPFFLCILIQVQCPSLELSNLWLIFLAIISSLIVMPVPPYCCSFAMFNSFWLYPTTKNIHKSKFATGHWSSFLRDSCHAHRIKIHHMGVLWYVCLFLLIWNLS